MGRTEPPTTAHPANSLCEAMGGGKERVAPGCLSPGASLRVVKRGKAGADFGTRKAPARTGQKQTGA